MQTLNLNLSLQINIGTDGKAEVSVLKNDTTAADVTSPKIEQGHSPIEYSEPDRVVIAETAAQALAHATTSNASLDNPTVLTPPPTTTTTKGSPAQRQYRTDFDIAALTKKYVSNPVINNPTNEEFERIFAETGITPEDWYNHPDYKTWIAPKQSAIEIPEKGIDLDSEYDDGEEYVPNTELPSRPAPKPRGSIREEAKRLYGDNYAAIANTIEQLEHENDILYLPRNPSEKAAMTPEQLAMAEIVRAEVEARERAAQNPPPPPPPPVAQQAVAKPAAQTPPPPPPVVKQADVVSDNVPTFAELQARVAAGEAVFPASPVQNSQPAIEMPTPMNPPPAAQQTTTQVVNPSNAAMSDRDKIEKAAAALFGA